MKNYYNDKEPFAVKWLKELIADGLIPPGDVDDRSIADVVPSDLTGYTQCHFFCGISGWVYALKLAGWPEDREVWTGSCPCQPFSVAGKGEGKSDKRHLWPEFLRLIEGCRPSIVFGEQVSGKGGKEWLDGKDKIMQAMLDRETVKRVLQVFNTFGELPPEMQRMLQGGGAREKKHNTKRRKIEMVQGVSCEKQSGSTLQGCEISSDEKRHGIFFGQSYQPPARCHKCGRLRTDRDTVQPDRGKNMGQPIARQGGLFEGVYSGQCACGALLHKRNGKHMGGKQDNRNIQCDNGSSTLSVRGISEQIRICFEASDRHKLLSGVRIDLASRGYRCGTMDIPAAGVGAPHIRQRLFWVADANGRNTGAERLQCGRQYRQQQSDGCDGDRVAESMQQRAGRQCENTEIQGNGPEIQSFRVQAAKGFDAGGNGYCNPWRNSVLIPCADGKWRRVPGRVGITNNTRPQQGSETAETARYGDSIEPTGVPNGMGFQEAQGMEPELEIEPTLFPLASGIPNRVGILRGAGNSIVPQVAAEFIKAVMGALPEQAQGE